MVRVWYFGCFVLRSSRGCALVYVAAPRIDGESPEQQGGEAAPDTADGKEVFTVGSWVTTTFGREKEKWHNQARATAP